jgi:hypothetical protein
MYGQHNKGHFAVIAKQGNALSDLAEQFGTYMDISTV